MTSQRAAHDATGWSAFYRGRDPDKYQEYCEERYKPFLALITARMMGVKHVDPHAHRICLELGCGMGTISSILGKVYKDATLVLTDINPDMLMMAAQRMAAQMMHENVAMFCVDLLSETAKPQEFEPSVVHSHGLLEHFTDAEALGIVDRHRDYYQVHYIPGEYPEPSYGDERLLPLAHWVKLLRPSRAYTFNDGLDYALVFHPKGYQ